MRKLIIIAIVLVSFQATAQRESMNQPERSQRMSDFTAEEIAVLKTKKMTLFLDLTESQQQKIQKIHLENAIQRKAMMKTRKARKAQGNTQKPTKEERLSMVNARLDHQIAMKKKMKNILNEDQYTKWEKAHLKKALKKKQMRKKGMRQTKQI